MVAPHSGDEANDLVLMISQMEVAPHSGDEAHDDLQKIVLPPVAPHSRDESQGVLLDAAGGAAPCRSTNGCGKGNAPCAR